MKNCESLRRRPCEEDKYFQFPKNFHFQPSDIFYRLGKDLSLLNCLIAYCLGAVTQRGAGDRPAVWWGSYGNLMEVWSDQIRWCKVWAGEPFQSWGFYQISHAKSMQKNNCKRSKLVFSALCPPLPWRDVVWQCCGGSIWHIYCVPPRAPELGTRPHTRTRTTSSSMI